jgi:hypothetical protein
MTTSTATVALAETGYSALYAGLMLVGASAVFAAGVPTDGCYPGCVGGVDPTLAIAGAAAVAIGVVLAGLSRFR